jgi:ribosome-binding factor A
MSSHRSARVAEEIKRELSQMIREELKDPRVKGLISVTHVDVTNDLRYAKVFISSLGDTQENRELLKGLEKAGGYLRSELAKRLQLRFTPELIFRQDSSIEYGSKISRILSDIQNTEEGEKGSND